MESLFAGVFFQDSSSVCLADRISDTNDDILESLSIKEALDTLPERERQVIKLRYFQDATQQQVAKILGISQVQVSRIEKKVLLAMRKKL